MSRETAFIAALRGIIRHPGARELLDDAAVIAPPIGRDLVVTHDMIAEGVHFLSDDPPGDVAWKLLAVNLSDLAAKGATPIGSVLGYTLSEPAWDEAFVAGLGRALDHFGVPLLGGDTIARLDGAGRVFGLTAFGQAPRPVPDRRAARSGDALWVCGNIGDAGLGLRIARGEIEGPRRLLKAYRLPMPKLAEGRRLAPLVSAMADVSDGLLIDASRIAAATAGDDYALVFAASEERSEEILALGVAAVRIGSFSEGAGLAMRDRDGAVPVPARLGFVHG